MPSDAEIIKTLIAELGSLIVPATKGYGSSQPYKGSSTPPLGKDVDHSPSISKDKKVIELVPVKISRAFKR